MGRDCHRFPGDGGGISKRKANGCMAAFYHLFDFHHFYFSSHHHLTIHSPSSTSKGLKIIQESSLPSTTYKDTQSFNIPPVRMRVRTETGTTSSRLRALATDTSTSSSEICNSPSSKTPNLVARLMGLDLLPDKTHLNDSLQNHHSMTHYGTSRLSSKRLSGTRLGTRSLPGSPRMSSSRKSDFDIHRLSLQLNKENKHEEFSCSRLKERKQNQEENWSSREYARQIVKQIKERVVTRRVVGMDITNSVKNRGAGKSLHSNELRRDTTVSCSPRTRFSDKENKASTIHKSNTIQSSVRPTQKPKPTTTILVSVSKASGEKQNKKRVKQRELRPINRCKKAESETRFSPRPIKHSPTPDTQIKQREAFLFESAGAKAKKKIPKSNDLDNISATRPPKKQVNVPGGQKSNEDPSICISQIDENIPKVDNVFASSSSSNNTEQVYIKRVINLAGINTDSLVSSATMLDPSIFHKLEHSGENPSGSLALRCNRRLLFDLVSEILTETVKKRRKYHGSELMDEVCSVVERNSHNLCQIPGEIGSMEEQGEEIIAEIERDFIDELVRETASRIKTTPRRKLSHSVI
ncbi:hypothetical protein AALP_AA8G294500 [Arabis alpina]|uniref:DUF3741 domain-containing protein n=1 Tax=Arabis alpina TaxID=50452 RepID=A0A087GA93_ARAAL|nr:hypothetical protein AALP_AA8G294500 [Arabis alpina]